MLMAKLLFDIAEEAIKDVIAKLIGKETRTTSPEHA
jgi:hypothetical protein